MTAIFVELPDKEKLMVLRRLDHFRHWSSLDDKRFCLVCAKVISGRGIQVMKTSVEGDSMEVVCPTPQCSSMPMDWVIPSQQILDVLAARSEVSIPRG